MATATARHPCGLCGQAFRPDQLARLHGDPCPRFGFAVADRPRAGVCASCPARPISEEHAGRGTGAAVSSRPCSAACAEGVLPHPGHFGLNKVHTLRKRHKSR
jgi:hypothetical protein